MHLFYLAPSFYVSKHLTNLICRRVPAKAQTHLLELETCECQVVFFIFISPRYFTKLVNNDELKEDIAKLSILEISNQNPN